MSTISAEEFDYRAYTRENPPDPARIRRGVQAREQRRTAALARRTVWLEQELLDEFQQLTPAGESSEQLINRALREWLAARAMKELVREELQLALRSVQVRPLSVEPAAPNAA